MVPARPRRRRAVGRPLGSDSDEEADGATVLPKLSKDGQVLQISVSVQYGKKSLVCRLSPYLPVENAVYFILREFGMETTAAPFSDYKLYKITRRSKGADSRKLLDAQQSLLKQHIREGVRRRRCRPGTPRRRARSRALTSGGLRAFATAAVAGGRGTAGPPEDTQLQGPVARANQARGELALPVPIRPLPHRRPSARQHRPRPQAQGEHALRDLLCLREPLAR